MSIAKTQTRMLEQRKPKSLHALKHKGSEQFQ